MDGAQRGGEAGRDRGGGVGRSEVHGSRHDRKDALFGAEPEGQVARFVPDEGQRPGRDLARKGAVRGGANDLQARAPLPEQRGQTTTQLGDPAKRAADAIGIEQPPARGMAKPGSDALAADRIGGQEEEIDPRPEGREHVEDLVRPLVEGLHVEGVGDRDALEPELGPEEIGHHLASQG